jgi:hypothetical protein
MRHRIECYGSKVQVVRLNLDDKVHFRGLINFCYEFPPFLLWMQHPIWYLELHIAELKISVSPLAASITNVTCNAVCVCVVLCPGRPFPRVRPEVAYVTIKYPGLSYCTYDRVPYWSLFLRLNQSSIWTHCTRWGHRPFQNRSRA